MQIKEVEVSALIPYAKNSRTHDDKQVAQLAASIDEFGFRNPILVDGLGIIAGHGRLMAAKKLGLKKVPTIDCSDLTEAQKKANRDNKKIAREQMSFQERMSSTSHQREMADLRAAGLNPNLSAGGSGSSSPSGASATMQAPQIAMPEMLSALASITQLEQNQQRIDIDKSLAAANISKNLTDQELTRAKTTLSKKGLLRAEALI